MSGILCSMVAVVKSAAATRIAKTISAIGNAQVDTAQSQFGGAAVLFDGTGDYLQVTNNSDFNFGSADWTIEGWVRFSTLPNFNGLMGMATVGGLDGWNFQWGNDGRLYLEFRNSANTAVTTIVNTTAIATNTWTHFAFSRSGNTVRAFKNGTQDSSLSVTWPINSSTANLLIGDGYGISTTWGSAGDFAGWLDEIRISNIARYTGNFTAPTAAFVNDVNTVLLIHANGTDASTTFTDDNA